MRKGQLQDNGNITQIGPDECQPRALREGRGHGKREAPEAQLIVEHQQL